MTRALCCALLAAGVSGCHRDWDEQLARCIAEGRCEGVGGGAGGSGGGAEAGGSSGSGGGSGGGNAEDVRLSFVGGPVDFGDLPLTQPAAPIQVRLRNDGSSPVTLVTLTPTGPGSSEFNLSNNLCATQPPGPGGECTADVALTSGGADAGEYLATLEARALGGQTASTPLRVNRVGPRLQLEPAVVDFGAVPADGGDTRVVSLRNVGLTASPAVTLVAPAAPFNLSAGSCQAAQLAPDGGCTFVIGFAPSGGLGAFDAGFSASAGSATASGAAIGIAYLPGTLVAVPSRWDAGMLDVGTVATQSVQVTNTVGDTAGPLTVGQPGAPFALANDLCTGALLDAGASCTFQVEYRPQVRGQDSTTFLVTDTAGGTAAPFSAFGHSIDFVQVVLRVDGGDAVGGIDVASNDAGPRVCPPDCSFTARRSSTLTLTPVVVAGRVFTGWSGNTCSAAGPCSFVANLDAGHQVTAAFSSIWSLQVGVRGPGYVVSDDAGIFCPGRCTLSGPTGTQVRLRQIDDPAVRVLGTLDGFSGCNDGGSSYCDVRLTSNRFVDAGFTRANVVFLSRESFPTTRGSVFAYDGICQDLARDAGLFELATDGGRWIAFMSQSDAGGAVTRLNGAQGFIRPDGRVVAVAGVSNVRLSTSINMDQYLELDPTHVRVITGTNELGQPATTNCANWTSSTAGFQAMGGAARTDAIGWQTGDGVGSCGTTRLYCFEANRTRTLSVPRPIPGSRFAFTSAAQVLGDAGQAVTDGICRAEALDAGLALSGSFISLRALQNAPASGRLVTRGPWFRVDGQQLTYDAVALFDGGVPLLAPIDRDARGTPVAPGSAVWSGSAKPGSDAGLNCTDFSTVSGSSLIGTSTNTAWWWWRGTGQVCGTAANFYCFQN